MPFPKPAALVLAASLPLLAADYLPLQSGNSWTYSSSSGDSFTIRVGTPLYTQDDHVYYRLTGYVDRPLWARSLQNGNLVYLDEETGAERPLTVFEDLRPIWAAAPFRPCDQETQSTPNAPRYLGPIGEIASTAELQYRAFSCLGVESETYAPNLGLLRRVVNTQEGFRTFTLVEARIGHLTFAGRPATSFHASVAKSAAGPLTANLRLAISAPEPLTLVYPSSQDYDAIVWDSSGRPVHQWSDARAFTPATRTRVVDTLLAHNVELPDLPDGAYMLEAWLTANPASRAFSALTPFQVKDGRVVMQ